MIRSSLTLICVLSIPLLLSSQRSLGDDSVSAPPKTIMGYLKPGMQVGVTDVDGTAAVFITVYSEHDFQIAKTTKGLPKLSKATDVARKHPKIKQEFDAYIERQNLSKDDHARVYVVAASKTAFGTIDIARDDYVLIRFSTDSNAGNESKRNPRRIIPRTSIGSIQLDAWPVRFTTFPDRGTSRDDG